MRVLQTRVLRALPVGLALAVTLVGGSGSLSRVSLAAGANPAGFKPVAIRHTECLSMNTLLKAAPTTGQNPVGCRSIEIQVSDGKLIAPVQVLAGRSLVTVTNTGSAQETPALVRLPDDVTLDDLKTALGAEESAPSWFYTAVFPGIPATVNPGQQAQAIVDLDLGRYATFLLGQPESATAVTVVPSVDAADSATAPAADATVTIQEFSFQLPTDLVGGEQIWEVTNTGDQPHELGLSRLPDGTTLEQVQTLLSLPDGAPVPPGLPDPAQIVPAGGLGILSAGQTAWAVLDLEPGTYLALCYVPDQESGMPHAFMGMIQVFTVHA